MSEGAGLIIAAIIAGYVAFFGLIISKEQTVSDFRQKWIDALREDVAATVSLVTSIHWTSVVDHQNPAKWPTLKPDFGRLNELIARIRLRLNPDEKRKKDGEAEATKAVLKTLEQLEGVFGNANPQWHTLPSLRTDLVTKTQVILRANWKRVRSGEIVYQIAKWTTLGIAILAVIYLVLHKLNVIRF
jgi:hypothetical protein